MITVESIIDGVPLVMPVDLKVDWPDIPLSDFPHCCGAGSGIGELIVPERIWGLSVTPACYIHDNCWNVADPTWGDFHQSNSMFLHNILSIIQHQSVSNFVRMLRNYRAITYFNAVDSVGAKIFWDLKRDK